MVQLLVGFFSLSTSTIDSPVANGKVCCVFVARVLAPWSRSGGNAGGRSERVKHNTLLVLLSGLCLETLLFGGAPAY